MARPIAAAENVRVDFRKEVLGVLDQLHEAARNPERVRQLTDHLTVLARDYLTPSIPDPMPNVHLSKTQARLIARMLEADGGIVTRDQLMDAVYFDKMEEPHDKILDVMICGLRKKLKSSGFQITNGWGNGYKLEHIV